MKSKFAPKPEPTPWEMGTLVPMKTSTDAMLEKYPVATPERLREIVLQADLERRGKYLK